MRRLRYEISLQSETVSLIMHDQKTLGTDFQKPIEKVEEYRFEPIKGYPMLHWKGKRPFESTQFYPAQLKETHGEEVDGWYNRIYWGDNLQVMSHLLKEFRGKVSLIYLDPPYDSQADYRKSINLRGQNIKSDYIVFEEKQYGDIWTNDEYLQFMYERFVIMRELLSDNGSIWVHCDYRRDAHLRIILDEIFGQENYRSQIVWNSTRSKGTASKSFGVEHNILYYYTKSVSDYTWNVLYGDYDDDKLDRYYCFFEQKDGSIVRYTKSQMREFRLAGETPEGRRFALIPLLNLNKNRPNLTYEFLGFTETWAVKREGMLKLYADNRIVQLNEGALPLKKQYFDEVQGVKINTIWDDITPLNSQAKEKVDYPTQKPEALLDRIIRASTNQDDIVFDCFMGSGTTQAASMKLGRRFIGADINLGAIQTSTKRLISLGKGLANYNPSPTLDFNEEGTKADKIYTGFQVYNVNNYDFFRNELEAKDLLVKALEVQPLVNNSLYDGEKDGRMVKIMPINRIATRADLNQLITNFDIRTFENRQKENPGKPVEYLTLICMGHEPDLAAHLQNEMKPFKIDVEVVDILRDNSKLELKREAEAEIAKENGKIFIKQFFPMNLLQKLSLEKQNVENWKELVESVMIDFNYDGAIFEPTLVDVPEGNNLVKGEYQIPADAGTVRVKITDLLSESLEATINA